MIVAKGRVMRGSALALASSSANMAASWNVVMGNGPSKVSSPSVQIIGALGVRCICLSGLLVLVVPHHRLPEFDLVSLQIHDPGELSVLMQFWSPDDFHATRT